MTSWPLYALDLVGERSLKLSELTFDDWHNSTLLDGRGTFETIGIDACMLLILVLPTICRLDGTSQKLGLQVHCIERIDSLVIVRLDLTCASIFISLRSITFAARCQWRCAPCGILHFLPSGISSSPLSVEAMIAVSIDMNI